MKTFKIQLHKQCQFLNELFHIISGKTKLVDCLMKTSSVKENIFKTTARLMTLEELNSHAKKTSL